MYRACFLMVIVASTPWYCNAVVAQPPRFAVQQDSEPPSAGQQEELENLERVVESLISRLNARDFAAVRTMCAPGFLGEEIAGQLEKLISGKENVRIEHLEFEDMNFANGNRGVRGTVEIQLAGTVAENGRAAFPDYPLDFHIAFTRMDDQWKLYALNLDFDRAVISRQIRAFYDAFAAKDVDAIVSLFPTGEPGSPLETQVRERAAELIQETGRFKIKAVELKRLKIDGNKAMAHVAVVQSVRKVAADEYVDQAPIEFDWELRKAGWDWKLITFAPHEEAAP